MRKGGPGLIQVQRCSAWCWTNRDQLWEMSSTEFCVRNLFNYWYTWMYQCSETDTYCFVHPQRSHIVPLKPKCGTTCVVCSHAFIQNATTRVSWTTLQWVCRSVCAKTGMFLLLVHWTTVVCAAGWTFTPNISDKQPWRPSVRAAQGEWSLRVCGGCGGPRVASSDWARAASSHLWIHATEVACKN